MDVDWLDQLLKEKHPDIVAKKVTHPEADGLSWQRCSSTVGEKLIILFGTLQEEEKAVLAKVASKTALVASPSGSGKGVAAAPARGSVSKK